MGSGDAVRWLHIEMKTEKGRPNFRFGVGLRIKDAPFLHGEITETLGQPTECHVAGEAVWNNPERHWPNDIWLIDSPLGDEKDINEHLAWLADFIRPHHARLAEWRSRGAHIDVYMYYDCDEEHRGFGLRPDAISLLAALGVPLEVSVMR